MCIKYKATCHYCELSKEKCKCFDKGQTILPAEKDAQRFTKVLPKEDGRYPFVNVVTCAYCGNFVQNTKVGCTICKGRDNLCDLHHLPKATCGCSNSDGLKSINMDDVEIWNEKHGPLNPENIEMDSPHPTEFKGMPDIKPDKMSASHPVQMLDELHEMARDIINKKNHDYRGAMEDDYANFRGSTALGIHPGHGVLLRIQDKMMRVKTFIDKGELHVKSESIDDALVDITNYCALLRGIIQTEGKY